MGKSLCSDRVLSHDRTHLLHVWSIDVLIVQFHIFFDVVAPDSIALRGFFVVGRSAVATEYVIFLYGTKR